MGRSELDALNEWDCGALGLVKGETTVISSSARDWNRRWELDSEEFWWPITNSLFSKVERNKNIPNPKAHPHLHPFSPLLHVILHHLHLPPRSFLKMKDNSFRVIKKKSQIHSENWVTSLRRLSSLLQALDSQHFMTNRFQCHIQQSTAVNTSTLSATDVVSEEVYALVFVADGSFYRYHS